MSKPIEDPPSLVDILAREHAARRALIEAECAQALALAATNPASDAHAEHAPSDTHVDAPVSAAVVVPSAEAVVAASAAGEPVRASTPRILVEELSRKCCERRAALDEEARRG